MTKNQDQADAKERSLTDAEGNTYNFNEDTRIINYKVDRHGFIYNSKGERTGNVHGHEFIDGYNYE